MKCAHRFYLNNNQCLPIPKECYSYDIVTGACISCAPGYQFQEGKCKSSEAMAFVIGNQCVTCFNGYKMVNQRCVYSPNTPSSNLQAKNILCLAWKDSSCVLCTPKTYLSSRGICELVDPFCTQFDYNLEVCNGCEQGFSLRNGRCFRIW